MRLIFLFVLITIGNLIFGQTYSNYLIISDIDDTYKITNTTSGITAFANAMFSSRVFAGTSELYSEMQAQGARLYFVSNTPTVISWRVKRLLKRNKITCEAVFLRSTGEKGFEHKIGAIRNIADNHPDAYLILLGDNSGNDEQVYDSIQKIYPARLAAIYIRPVKDLPRSYSQHIYYTAVDIAYFECVAGRLGEIEVERIFNNVLESRASLVVPDFISINKSLIMNEVAGCFYPHCLFKNKSIEWVLEHHKHM